MFFAVIMSIPYSILCLPAMIGEIFDKIKGSYYYSQTEPARRIGLSIFLYLALFFGVSIIFALLWSFGYQFNFKKDSLGNSMIGLGIILIFVLMIIGGILLFRFIFFRGAEKMSTTLPAEFIKAKYNKYCPKIDLIRKEDETR
jgi:hypothetical protein